MAELSEREESMTVGAVQKYDLKLNDGTAYDEVISCLQKMIRRGLEKEAMVIAIGLMESSYGMSLAKRLIVIAAEDIGLADPATAAQICTLAMSYIALKKESKSGYVDSMPLCMATLLACRAQKNREIDGVYVAVVQWMKEGRLTPAKVIEQHKTVAVDSHTARGKTLLREKAVKEGRKYEDVSWEDFYLNGATVSPLQEVRGNYWDRLSFEMKGMSYDEYLERCKQADADAAEKNSEVP
jgi:replication-associated recombination protein RarA